MKVLIDLACTLMPGHFALHLVRTLLCFLKKKKSMFFREKKKKYNLYGEEKKEEKDRKERVCLYM